jgi:ABC-type dipeptide/oligopeptide/nickel transport system permease component
MMLRRIEAWLVHTLRRHYAVRRGVVIIPQVLGITCITFVLIRLAPANPAYLFAGPTASPETIKAIEHSLGLDQPIPVQYIRYMANLLHGNLGISLVTSQPVLNDLLSRFPATLELVTFAMFFVAIFHIPMGAIAAKGQGLANRTANVYGLLAGSLPDFWWGLMLIFIFYAKLSWVPAPLGRIALGAEPPQITGFLTVDSLLSGNLAAFRSALGHLILPGLTLAFIYGAPVLKHMRASMSAALRAPYVEYAQMCGLKSSTIFRYAFRNAIIPALTMGGVTYAYLIGGVALVETVFAWGGLGQYAVQVTISSDYAALSGTVLVATLFALCVYLVLDLVYSLIDPRVRY